MSILVFVLSIVSMVSFEYGLSYERSYSWVVGYEEHIIINPLMLTISALALIAVIVICLIMYKTPVAILGIGFPALNILVIFLYKDITTDTVIIQVLYFIMSLSFLVLWRFVLDFEEIEENPYKKEERKYEIVIEKSKCGLNGLGAIFFEEVNGKLIADEMCNIYYYTDKSNNKTEMVELLAEETDVFLLKGDQKPYLVEIIETFRTVKKFYRKIKISKETENVSYKAYKVCFPKNVIAESFEL